MTLLPPASAWRGAMRDRAAELLAFALPQRCGGCGYPVAADHALCDACSERIPPVAAGLCVVCLSRERDPVGCARHRGFTAWPAWTYDERAALVVQALKFHGRSRLARALGPLIARSLPPGYRPDMVLEVPLHPARLRDRGFDQAAALADAVALTLGAPRLRGALRRVRPTRPQTGLGASGRRRNLEGAFMLADPRAFSGRRVLVVDDVLTTGSTLSAALAPLRQAGAETMAAALAWAG